MALTKFVSYAQNFEDIMLRRALHGIENGFYIDVGANHPDAESVTKAFYEMGWSGINIEPNPDMYEALKTGRTRDTNIEAGCWRESGEQVLYIFPQSSAFSTLEKAHAEMLHKEGWISTQIPMRTVSLNQIWADHVGNRDVHFLKVDVEGGELGVFQGLDLQKYRPWIILGEAHGPDFQANHYQAWEDLILGADYSYLYTDGLNRYYVAQEKMGELSEHFSRPPNVYDDYEVCLVTALRARAEHAEITRAAAWLALENANSEVARLNASTQSLSNGLDELRSSTSWRVTQPLRWVRQALRG